MSKQPLRGPLCQKPPITLKNCGLSFDGVLVHSRRFPDMSNTPKKARHSGFDPDGRTVVSWVTQAYRSYS
jgi:hypothetical protein